MPKEIDLAYMPESTRILFNKLQALNFIQKYSLVGGTALSIQMKHRQSEDLDFIYDNEILNLNSIKRSIHNAFNDYQIIRQDGDYQIDFLINNCKLTFFSKNAIQINFNVKDYTFLFGKINIAKIDIIAVLKLVAISQRNTIRDYYDLFYISKNIISLSDIISKCKNLLPNLSPITYSETLVYTKDILEDDLSNHLKPKINVTKQEISEYFINELKIAMIK